jgi:hypothetical protein
MLLLVTVASQAILSLMWSQTTEREERLQMKKGQPCCKLHYVNVFITCIRSTPESCLMVAAFVEWEILLCIVITGRLQDSDGNHTCIKAPNFSDMKQTEWRWLSEHLSSMSQGCLLGESSSSTHVKEPKIKRNIRRLLAIWNCYELLWSVWNPLYSCQRLAWWVELPAGAVWRS